jgi:hypothetical protein
MALFGWFRKDERGVGKQQAQWREAWTRAVEAEDASQLPRLRSELKTLAPAAEDVELEQEMLDALETLVELRTNAVSGPLPSVETHHRIVGSDICHFSAPASLPDDPSQPSGRVLLTNARSLFLGGAHGGSVAWHLVRDVIRLDRDVLIIRHDGSAAAHFRFNSFADAVSAAFIARRLKGIRNTGTL